MPRLITTLTILLLSANTLFAAGPVSPERFHYSWRLRGGLAWLASLRFPTSGFGELRTVRSSEPSNVVDTQLKITPRDGDGFYLYQSQIDGRNSQTLMTYHGYEWGDKSRHERTLFDYVKHLARIRKETGEIVENRVKPIPPDTIRDVLTAIYYLRQNSAQLANSFSSNIYSDGKLYPVVFVRQGRDVITLSGHRYDATIYRISAPRDAQRRWPGAVRVWITEDEAAIPVRIEMQRNFATLRLDLDQ
jgi:hypothetical protein